jgi:hypothetical protein
MMKIANDLIDIGVSFIKINTLEPLAYFLIIN